MENEEEKHCHNIEIKRCFALHCKHNTCGQCDMEQTYILVNGMCDGFAIRPRESKNVPD